MKLKPDSEQELPDFSFPVFLKSNELEDFKLKNKLPLELFIRHEEYVFTFKGIQYVISIPDSSGMHPKDTLKLHTSTWGENSRVPHVYGYLEFAVIYFININDRTKWLAEADAPKMPSRVNLYRSLTGEEVLANKNRYVGYSGGDMIRGFKTLEDITEHARIVVEKHFPGFKLIV